jgi:micrococcal nuclease
MFHRNLLRKEFNMTKRKFKYKYKSISWLAIVLFTIMMVVVIQQTSSDGQATIRNENNLISALVTRVVDGDTMKVTLDDGRATKETIRLLLVDTPETVHPTKDMEPFGPEASSFAKRLLTNQKVQLEIDVSERDKYGRLLVYLWLGDQMFNELLLEEGLARVAYVIPPNIKYVDQFRAIQQKSQKSAKGIWRIESYATDTGFQSEDQLNHSNIEIISVTSPIKTNQEATLEARVTPDAVANIQVKYKGGASSAAGLESKQANAEGFVSWSWKVSPVTSPGTWTVTVTSGEDQVTTDFVVE